MSQTREKYADVKLNWDIIPDYVKQDIAAAAWNAIQSFMERPEAHEILEHERELLRLEGNTLLDPRPKQKRPKKDN